MKKISVFFLVLGLLVSCGNIEATKSTKKESVATSTTLVNNRVTDHGNPYFHHGYWGGYPFGYGYFNYFNWPWIMNRNYGFAFYPFYNYNVYYSTYAVIAYSPSTGKVGWSWGGNYLESTASQAESQCGEKDCKSVVWVQGGCAAIAVSKKTNRLGWAYAYDKLHAKAGAVNSCRSGAVGNAQCTPLAWVCSF